MSFFSFNFALFMALTLLGCHLLRDKPSQRKNLLLLASYYFYACWDWRFCGLLLVITLVNFVAGRGIAAAERPAQRRVWLGVSLTVCLGTLAYFKYVNFFIEGLLAFGSALGVRLDVPLLHIMLPVGISFFTFQSLSYVLDIYRGQQQPTRNLRDFALFVAFFPTVLAGPVTRARELLPQLSAVRPMGDKDIEGGLALIARGIIKKLAFADVLALSLIEPAFAAPASYSPLFLLVALYGYSFQIYMDVSAYTDIARGTAALCGFDLPQNFNRPYMATTVSNFWQRWHMSVSGFFRDYVFHSLGGSRHGPVYLNLMITFLAIGLWHGGGLNFLLYGALHGGMVCFDRWRRSRREVLGAHAAPQMPAWLAVALTFHFVVFSRLLFRTPNIESAAAYLRAMGHWQQTHAPWNALGLGMLGTAALLHWLLPSAGPRFIALVTRLTPVWQGVGLAVLCWGVMAIHSGASTFVYFGF